MPLSWFGLVLFPLVTTQCAMAGPWQPPAVIPVLRPSPGPHEPQTDVNSFSLKSRHLSTREASVREVQAKAAMATTRLQLQAD